MATSSQFTSNVNVALEHLINKVVSGIDQTTQFLSDQIPDVIHQLLLYTLVKDAIVLGIAVTFVLASTLGAWWAFSNRRQDSVERFFAGMIWVIGNAISVAVLIAFGIDLLKVWLAPKIWLIEYAASLAKG